MENESSKKAPKKALRKTDVKSSAKKKSKKFDVTIHLFGKSFKGKL